MQNNNGLNFDFDTPLEQAAKPSVDRTPSVDKVRVSSVEIESVTEQIAHRGKDRGAARASTALTADEVKGTVSREEEPAPAAEKAPIDDGYSDAAHLIFENMRRKLAQTAAAEAEKPKLTFSGEPAKIEAEVPADESFDIQALIDSADREEQLAFDAITPEFAAQNDGKRVLRPIMAGEEEELDADDAFVASVSAAVGRADEQADMPTERELAVQRLVDEGSELVDEVVQGYHIGGEQLEQAYSAAASGLERVADELAEIENVDFAAVAVDAISAEVEKLGFEPKQEQAEFDFDAVTAAAEDAVDQSATVMFDAPSDEKADEQDGATTVFTAIDGEQWEADDDQYDDYYDDYDDEQDDEFDTVDDYYEVSREFTSRKRALFARTTLTAVICAALFGLVAATPVLNVGANVFYITVAVLMGLALVINYNTTFAFFSMFKLSFSADTAPAAAGVAALAQAIVFACVGAPAGMSTASVFAAAACLALLFDNMGKFSLVRRLLCNLDLISNDEIKAAAVLIDEPRSSTIINDRDFGDALICGRRNVIDLKGYVAHSFSMDMYERLSGRIFAAVFVLALIIACIFGIRYNEPLNCLTGLCAALCIGSPLSALFSNHHALSRTCAKLRERQTVLTGFDAVEQISECNALMLSDHELFHDEYVTLHDIKGFGDMALDQAILDAAAILIHRQSPLAGLFYGMIGGKTALLPPVDSVVYEEKLGLTGWTGGRKIIVGNRMIMEAHGVAVPPIEVDRKILQKGYRPVYVATEGKLSALFVIGYNADEELVDSIHAAVNAGMTIVVRTNDCNIDESTVADAYGIYRDSVKIMTADSAGEYDDCTAGCDSEQALMAGKTADGFVRGVVGAYRLQSNITLSTVVQLVLMFAGLCAAAVLAVMGNAGLVNVYSVSIFGAICGLLSHAVHLFRKTI